MDLIKLTHQRAFGCGGTTSMLVAGAWFLACALQALQIGVERFTGIGEQGQSSATLRGAILRQKGGSVTNEAGHEDGLRCGV